MQREKFSRTCEACVQNCKQKELTGKCEYFQLGKTSSEYWSLIKESGLNIRKMCDKNNISMNIMLNMLNNKQNWTFKYRTVLNGYLYEKEEYLKWLEENDGEVEHQR